MSAVRPPYVAYAQILAGALLLQPSPQDTFPHIAPAAADLLALAMRRHTAQDSLVTDYQARLPTD